jgi:peptide-methionine (S)-S-oxide reductase
MYKGKKYGISKSTFNQGKSFKLFAEELGGSDFISLNYFNPEYALEKLLQLKIPSK